MNIDAYLIPIEDAAIVLILLAILLLIPICVVHYQRFGYLRPTRAIVFYSFLLYVFCAVFLIILPLTELTADFCEGRSPGSHVQLVFGKYSESTHLYPVCTIREPFSRRSQSYVCATGC